MVCSWPDSAASRHARGDLDSYTRGPVSAPPTATNERKMPCGICSQPVLESQFRAGAAKMFQGVLYCTACSKRAEEARLETLAFKQSLAGGTFYECAKCNAPVPLADIRS